MTTMRSQRDPRNLDLFYCSAPGVLIFSALRTRQSATGGEELACEIDMKAACISHEC